MVKARSSGCGTTLPPRSSGVGRIHRRPRSGRSVATLLVVLGAVALVVVPLLIYEFPREMARWYSAAADEAWLNDDYATALTHIDQALSWDATSALLHLSRASYWMELEEWQKALDDCNRARERAPGLQQVYEKRSTCLLHLGRHEAAVDDFKAYRKLDVEAASGPLRRAELLNGEAYVQAVANLELEQALQASEEAVRTVMVRSAVFDPEGYLAFGRATTARLQEDPQLALTSLNEAVAHASQAYQRASTRWQTLASTSQGSLAYPGSLEYEEQVAALKPHLLGILTARAELLEELKQSEAAAQDRAQIESITAGESHSVESPVKLEEAAARLRVLSGFLDTRGFVHYRLGNLPAARRDLQYAIEIAEWLNRADPWITEAHKHYVTDERELRKLAHLTQRNLAVLYYHQLLIHEALDRTDDAERDRARLAELGYEPSEDLF